VYNQGNNNDLAIILKTKQESRYTMNEKKELIKNIEHVEEEINHQELLFSDLNSAKNLLDGLNEILHKISNEVLKKNIETTVNKYLDTEKSKQLITNFLDAELSTQVMQQMNEMIRSEIEIFNFANQTKELLTDMFDDLLIDYAKSKSLPIINIIRINQTEIGRTKGEFFHEKFEEVLNLVHLDEPVMLVGPAGSGKNHVVFQIAQALGKKMYYTNNASNEFKLTGFIDAGGNYQETQFYKAFKNGGLFMLDEIDNSDSSALIVINSALANGYMAFPHATINKHPDFRIIAAANTWGKGSDLQYVGRNILDGATLDRFDNIFFDYDQKLEKALYPSQAILEFMWTLRIAVEEIKMLHIVSTRGIGKMYKKEVNHIPIETILRSNVVKNLKQDDVNLLIGCMASYINLDNPYYQALKELDIGR